MSNETNRADALQLKNNMPTVLWEALVEYDTYLKGACVNELLQGKEPVFYELHVQSFFDLSEVRDLVFKIENCIVSSSYRSVVAEDYHNRTGLAVYKADDLGNPTLYPSVSAYSLSESELMLKRIANGVKLEGGKGPLLSLEIVPEAMAVILELKQKFK